MYENGQGVQKDINQAKKWYKKAAELGSEEGKDALDRLK